MKTSLLYPSARLGTLGEQTLYHLSLDRALTAICPDTEKRAFFLSVLGKPLQCMEDIEYRRAILAELYSGADLFVSICKIFSALSRLKLESEEEKKEQLKLNRLPYGISVVTALWNMLKTSAITLERALGLIRELHDLLDRSNAVSPALSAIKESTRRVCRSSSYEEALRFCQMIQNRSSEGATDLQIVLDEKGYICSSVIIDRRFIHYTDPDLKQKKSLFHRSQQEEKSDPCAVFEADKRLFSGLSESAIKKLTAKVQALSERLFEEFCGYDRECIFYDVALRYLNALEEKRIGYAYPIPAREYKIEGLYDLLLITEFPSPDRIVPHDLTLENGQNGAVLFGENGSGKTVFLRSLGTAQVLFQAGLPLPALRIEMPVCRNILSQFSSAENEKASTFDAGRFEGEVREIAQIAEQIRQGDLVLLNETYQTTAYAEGAEGLAAFLEYLRRGNVFFFAVSHLTELQNLVTTDTALLLRSAENYTVVPIEE